MNPACIEVRHGSSEYEQTVALRDEVLRKPLGLAYEPGELEAEADSFHLALWRDGQPLACCILKPLSQAQLKLRQFAVHPDFQGTGLGRELVACAESFARGRRYREIVLHARETAAGFYRKVGYVEEGERFFEVGLPHVLMRKALC